MPTTLTTMIRKFEFPSKELAEQFITEHTSESERRDFIGPMRFATAWSDDEEPQPIAWTGWMVDTDRVEPLEDWKQYEVTPTNPMHSIAGREQEYLNNLL